LTIRKSCQKCVFIEYNNAYLYEYIKLSEKIQRLVIKMFYRVNHCLIIMNALNCHKNGTNSSKVMEIPAYKQKLNHEFLSRKRGIIMQ
jgi:ribosomal protein S8